MLSRRRFATGLVAVCVPAILALEAAAAVTKSMVSGTVLEYGIYEYRGESHTVPSPGAATGTVTHGSAENIRFVETTTVVPLRQGIHFGYKLRIEGLTDGVPVDVTYRIKHPPITNPKGTRSDISEGRLRIVPAGSSYEMINSYRLSEEYEVVPGTWTITILLGEQLLAEMSFQVVAQ